MKKFYLGLSIVGLTLLLFATAFAFSLLLQRLHVSTFSMAEPAAPVVIAAPMTSADEAQIASPRSDTVRMEEYLTPDHLCQKKEQSDRITDF